MNTSVYDLLQFEAELLDNREFEASTVRPHPWIICT